MNSQLTYVQLPSLVNPSFWNKLSDLKLNVYKLDETGKHIWGFFNMINSSAAFIEVDSSSFNIDFSIQEAHIPFHGKIVNKNTIEEFKGCDKMHLINEEGSYLFQQMKNGEVLKDPSLLNFFIILSFAEVKRYQYYHWFAFPVPKGVVVQAVSSSKVSNQLSEEKMKQLYKDFRKLSCNDKSYFLVTEDQDTLEVHTLSAKMKNLQDFNGTFYFGFYNIAQDPRCVGSQLRNYIAFILITCPFLQNKIVNFLTFILRRDNSIISCNESYVYKLKLPVTDQDFGNVWVGWEKNEKDKMGPRLANMKGTLDPEIISENAIDLNLKLMKWNLLPNIDLEKIKTTKFLFLGSGTLGCSVSRTLLGWGVRNFTFVDNSTVSFANPVRQSLYSYQDAVEMKPKALAAADSLRKIFPGVNSKGFQLTIPMPGHTVGESVLSQVKKSVEELETLIKEHDIIFLVTDSRESRWLPTLLCYMHNKTTINAAIGFDSYLVMRHGVRKNIKPEPIVHPEGFKVINGSNLGCYFCNDVTAPGDSLSGRTLDQQCTVTRPSVSQIAGALAAELAISVLQHSNGPYAPAFYTTSQDMPMEPNDESVLGIIPHSIRGFLHSFEQILPATEKYTNCVACSEMILNELERNGIEFLLKAFNNSKHLEDVALLTELFKDSNFSEVFELSDEEF